MKSIVMSSAMSLMFANFCVSPDGYTTDEQKKVFWNFSQKSEFTLVDYLSVLDFVNETKPAGENEMFILGNLEVVGQALFKSEKLGLIDLLKMYAETATERNNIIAGYAALGDIPSVEYINEFCSEKAILARKEILQKLFGKLAGNFDMENLPSGLKDIGGLSVFETSKTDDESEMIGDLGGWGDHKKRTLH